MSIYIALLRAVNVGGTGRLPMADLKAMCIDAGFESVQTYIASGNVVLHSSMSAKKVKNELESRLEIYAKKPVGVIVRTSAELELILKSNPYPDAEPSKTVALFLDRQAKQADIHEVTGAKNEELHVGKKELYVYYPDGMGTSRLNIKAAKIGTARNINTIKKLIAIAKKTEV